MSAPRFDFSDRCMSPPSMQVLSDGFAYTSAFLVGHYTDWWLAGYRGVGCSPAPYRMKACVRDDGIVFAPDTTQRSFREQACVCLLRKVAHIDDLPLGAIVCEYK